VSRVVGLFSEYICTSSNLLHKRLSLLTLAELNALLNDIVSIPVFHHLVERAIHNLTAFLLFCCLHELIDDVLSILFSTELQAFLDHVTSKLVVAQFNDLTFDALDYLVLIFLGFTML
jgi:hypothetical protein